MLEESGFELRPIRRPSRPGRRTYLPEPAGLRLRVPKAQPDLAETQLLLGAALRQAAVRRALRVARIDPALARFVALFPDDRPMRASQVAWMLGMSPASATRLLDRAEAAALIDKLRPYYDRRGVNARLTSKGRRVQLAVQAIVRSAQFEPAPGGVAYGRRAVNPWDPD